MGFVKKSVAFGVPPALLLSAVNKLLNISVGVA